MHSNMKCKNHKNYSKELNVFLTTLHNLTDHVVHLLQINLYCCTSNHTIPTLCKSEIIFPYISLSIHKTE
jgi:hypothetical protein